MSLKLSAVASAVPASPIRKLVPFAQKAKKDGVHVYHLNIGDPDISTPQEMIAVIRNWSANPLPYSQSHGEPALVASLLTYYHNLGFKSLDSQNLQVTFGGSEGILWALLTICNPGDEIIVFDPTYANYVSLAAMAKVRIVPILTRIEDGFHLPDKKTIEKKITPRTRAFLFSNPCNPTGTIYSKREVDMIVEIAKKHQLFVLSDEVYREFVYDKNVRSVSILEYLDDYGEGCLLIDSLSKRYSICGARVGVLVSTNQKLMEAFLKYAQARLSTGIIDQKVAAELTRTKKSYFNKVVAEYKKRRDTLVSGLQKIPGVVCQKPEGAFYVIARLPVDDSEDFARWLLTDFRDKNETVMVAPAAGFYATQGLGRNEIRIAYVLNVPSLTRSIELLSRALQIYKDA